MDTTALPRSSKLPKYRKQYTRQPQLIRILVSSYLTDLREKSSAKDSY